MLCLQEELLFIFHNKFNQGIHLKIQQCVKKVKKNH